jgi:hypothetical protein
MRWQTRAPSPYPLFLLALAQPHARPAAVLVDELDARSYQMFGAD